MPVDNAADNTQTTLYTDYYSNTDPIITDFSEFSVTFPSNASNYSEYDMNICFSKELIYLYEILPLEIIGDHIQNGIIGINSNGNRVRVCPESNCSSSDICSHIVLAMGECIISYDNYLFISCVPALDNCFYQNTCIMRYNITTHEYIKFAELPHDGISLFSYGNLLFAYTLINEKTAVLYCFDLDTNIGYKLLFSSKAIGPIFLGIAHQKIFVSDNENLYILDGNGQLLQTFLLDSMVIDFDIYNDTLFFSLEDNCIYTFDYTLNEIKLLLENTSGFDIYNDTIYYFQHKEILGLKFLCPFENSNGRIEFEIDDYPLFYGNEIYTYSLESKEHSCLLTVDNNKHFLNGLLHVSEFGLVYGYFSKTEIPQEQFYSTTVCRNFTTNSETVISEIWHHQGRSYGQ